MVAHQGKVIVTAVVAEPRDEDLAIGLHSDTTPLVGARPDVRGDLAIAIEGGIEAAIGVVAHQGEVGVAAVTAIPGDEDPAVGLHGDAVAGVIPPEIGGHDAVANDKGRRGVRGEHAGKNAEVKGLCVDCPCRAFQHVIAAQLRAAGQVVGGRDIGPGGFGQGGDERPPRFAAGDVAAVEQQVAVGAQSVPAHRQIDRPALQRFVVQGDGAQLYRALKTVRNKMNRIDPASALKNPRHLHQAVAGGVEHMHFQRRVQPGDQRSAVGNVAFDENDFGAFYDTGGRHVDLLSSMEIRLDWVSREF